MHSFLKERKEKGEEGRKREREEERKKGKEERREGKKREGKKRRKDGNSSSIMALKSSQFLKSKP